jgi:hypothetical protein
MATKGSNSSKYQSTTCSLLDLSSLAISTSVIVPTSYNDDRGVPATPAGGEELQSSAGQIHDQEESIKRLHPGDWPNNQPPPHTPDSERRYRVRSLKEAEEAPLPVNSQEELQLIAKYRQLQSRPQSNIDSWLEEWLHVVQMCEAVYLPDVSSPRAQRDFLLAIKGLDNTWTTTQQATLFRAQLTAQPIPALDDLVAEFAMYWRLTRPVASLLGTFATLCIDQSSDKRLV